MHVRNLKRVIASSCLFCERYRDKHDGTWESIAHENIQERRRLTSVPCGPKGSLLDYVPWYFAPRSPMLYAHHKGKVASNTEGQKPIIYFRSTVQKVIAAGIPFAFTDGHAIMVKSNFYDDIAHLDKIDWPLMSSVYWQAIDSDLDRPRRRQAEFLVHSKFPLSLVDEIVVYDRKALTHAQNCLHGTPLTNIIRVDKNWYF